MGMWTEKKLTYWVAQCKEGKVYNIRHRTKKQVVEVLKCRGVDPADYEAPKKVTITYTDAFDLVHACLKMDGGRWEG